MASRAVQNKLLESLHPRSSSEAKTLRNLPDDRRTITEGWSLGRRAKPFMAGHWEEYWERPIAELRFEYNLA